MKVGDLVKLKVSPKPVLFRGGQDPQYSVSDTPLVEDSTIGLVIYLDGTWAKVSWNFQNGAVGRNFRHDLEVISESR